MHIFSSVDAEVTVDDVLSVVVAAEKKQQKEAAEKRDNEIADEMLAIAYADRTDDGFETFEFSPDIFDDSRQRVNGVLQLDPNALASDTAPNMKLRFDVGLTVFSPRNLCGVQAC